MSTFDVQSGTELELDFVECLSPSQCRSIYSRQNKETRCLRRMQKHPDNCKIINPDYSPTIVLCKNFGAALAQFYFYGLYRGNDAKDESIPAPPVYFDWTEADPQQMIYIHPISKDIVYRGEEIILICEYSRYYFAIGSWFGIQTTNETRYIKAIDQKPCDFSAEKLEKDILNCTVDESWRGTYKAQIITRFDKLGTHHFYCLGPVWNSTEWVNVSLTFDVQEGLSPTILSVKPDNDEDFIVGQQHRMLVCSYKGKPTPTVSWDAPNKDTQFLARQLNTYTSAIIFPEIGFQTSGNYTCTVTSFLGTDRKSYFLKSHAEKLSSLAIIGIVLGILIVFTTIGGVLLRMIRIIKQQREKLRLLTEAEVEEFLLGNPSLLETLQNNDDSYTVPLIEALPYDKHYEIPIEDLFIDYSNILGCGAYGIVLKGKVRSSKVFHYVDISSLQCTDFNEELQVAVKVSKGDVNVTNFKALLSEIKVMAFLGNHENIVNLVGASTKGIKNRELYIAVEFCHRGSLDKFIKENKHEFVNDLRDNDDRFTLRKLLQWTCDVANGLEYIHRKKVIHADLAIRNILLTDGLRAKIGDFGLSRQLIESSTYTKTTKCALPWRNMAIESLRCLEFSSKSDIWAFGVTLWELFTLGDVPYPGINYAVEFVNLLEQGLRLYKPTYVANPTYDYMLICWSKEPINRPRASDVISICSKIMNNARSKKGLCQYTSLIADDDQLN